MASQREIRPGILRPLFYGAWLTATSPRLLWRVYVAQTAIALAAAYPLFLSLSRILDHSMVNTRFTEGFDLMMLQEVTRHPEFSRTAMFAVALAAVGMYLLVFLFLEGGVLNVYWGRASEKGRGTTQEFYAACALWFWRFMRLAVLALFPLGAAIVVRGALRVAAGKIGEHAADGRVGLYLIITVAIIGQLLLLFARLWHDMAQVHAVAERQGAMRKSFIAGARLAFGNPGRLYALQLITSLAGWTGFACAVWLWSLLPAHSVVRAFLLAQLALTVLVISRMWQRAAQVAWYQRFQELNVPEPAFQPVPMTIDARPSPGLHPQPSATPISS